MSEKELTIEKLKQFLTRWKKYCETDLITGSGPCDRSCSIPSGDSCEQAYQQLLQLIESQAQPSEEWVDTEARRFLNSIDDLIYPFQLIKTKDFLRNLIQELKGGKDE